MLAGITDSSGVRHAWGYALAGVRSPAGRALDLAPVSLSIGIVGLPNVGKSTLFNALTRANALASNYPFATIEPNVGIVGIPDPRLAALSGPVRLGPDRARDGAVRRHRRAGPGRLGWPGSRQPVPVAHPRDGRDLPGRQSVHRSRRQPRRRRRVPGAGHRDDRHRADAGRPPDAGEGGAAAGQGGQVRQGPRPGADRRRGGEGAAGAGRRHDPVRGRGRGRDRPGRPARSCSCSRPSRSCTSSTRTTRSWPTTSCASASPAWSRPAESIFLDAKTEAELAELEPEEAAELLAELGLGEPGLAQLARAGFAALKLSTFLTAGPKEARAWTIPAGATAPEAAGVIHTDFQRGFIKAEIVSFDDLMAAGSIAAARAAGKARIEGKDYVMRDGDVVEFRFNIRQSEVASAPLLRACSIGSDLPFLHPRNACLYRRATISSSMRAVIEVRWEPPPSTWAVTVTTASLSGESMQSWP